MTNYKILTDEDVRKLPMAVAVNKMEDAFREKANGTLIAPPRFRLEAPKGALIFTAGAATELERVIGFRVYDTFPQTSSSSDQAQLVAVWEYESGRFQGLVLGRLLGAMRTGAIGGVAIKHLSRPDARSLAIIGAGFQARTQVAAALTVREIDDIRIYNRTRQNAVKLGAEIEELYQINVRILDSAEEAVRETDLVICATKSVDPVIETSWLKPGSYVSSIGPKLVGAHELPEEIGNRASIVATDSIAQLNGYEKPFFLSETRVTGLEQIVAGYDAGYSSNRDLIVFMSVGLAGTEVILASELFNQT